MTKRKKVKSRSNSYDYLKSDDEEDKTMDWEECFCTLENKQSEQFGGETHEQTSESKKESINFRNKDESLESDSE